MDGSPDASDSSPVSDRIWGANIYPASPDHAGAPKWVIRVCESLDNWAASKAIIDLRFPSHRIRSGPVHFSSRLHLLIRETCFRPHETPLHCAASQK